MSNLAFNVKVMDVEDFVKRHLCQEVKSTFITEPSSYRYHSEGIFSEEIFGQLNTPDRLRRFGYIDLKTKIITPVLFRMIKLLAPWHIEVMAGRQKAFFNEATGELIKSTNTDGDTGFSFYMDVFPKIQFAKSKSISRSEKIEVLDKTRKTSIYIKYLVEPAGLRDISEDQSGRQTIEDINKLYIQLISYTHALQNNPTSRVYDPIRFNIQSKAVEIYSYLDNMMDGKRGFLRGQFGHRSIALGTANVITATSYSANSPKDPQFLKPTETRIGLYQCMKGTQPLIIHYLKTLFFDLTFGTDLNQTAVAVTDPKTLQVVYIEISDKERESFTTEDAVISMISRYQSYDFRTLPVVVYDHNGSPFYLRMLYDTGRSIGMFSSIDDLKASVPDYKKEYIRPMTYVDMFYIATYPALKGKHAFVTRYPVLGDGSCYPSEVHIATTTPARTVKLHDLKNAQDLFTLPEYPIIGKPYVDGVSLASPRLAGLGADHDGDRVSINFVLTDDGNDECREYLDSPRSMVDTSADLIASKSTDLVDYTLFALSHVPEDL